MPNKIRVIVPRDALALSMSTLNKTDTTLSQTASEQTLLPEGCCVLPSCSVKIVSVLCFGIEIQSFRSFALHPKRQLERLNPGIERVVWADVSELLLVQLGKQVEFPALQRFRY